MPQSKPSNLELKMVEALKKRATSGKCTVKTFNSVIMKFPKIDESFEKVRVVFKKYDKDSNAKIDFDELKSCFLELNVSLTYEQIKELYNECDMDANKGIDFKEFIVLLAFVHLLEDQSDPATKSVLLLHLQEAFNTIADAFVFFDKNKDGYVTRKEMVQTLNEASPVQETAGDIAVKRFQEMDWNRSGRITFKEFLFVFTNWVGVEDGE